MKLLILALVVGAGSTLRADVIDDYIKGHMQADHVPGLSLAVVKDGKVVRAQGYGLSNLELGTPVKPETVFRIASMSKQFCSAVILMLRDEGKIDLDASVSTYIPEAPASWSGVKIRNLLSHTSGIPNHSEVKQFDFFRQYNEKQYLALLSPLPLDSNPGDKYHYSNTGYSLLGLIAGRITKKPLGDLVQERIFGPLQMASSSYFKLESVVPNRANGYRWADDRFENAWPTRPAAVDGSGAVLSNVLDLAKWDAALYTDSPLSKAQKERLWTPNKLNDGTPINYGYGWTVRTGADGKSVSHSGNTPGFTSNILRLVDLKLTVILLRNSDPPGADKMALDIAKLYQGMTNPTKN